MSAARRRRVMLESDDEDGQLTAGGGRAGDEGLVTPRVVPPSEQARPTKSHPRAKVISAFDDDDDEGEGAGAGTDGGGGGGGGDGASGAIEIDDEAEAELERKKRRQLAERWSQLEEDSDHDLSDGGGAGSFGKTSALAQLQVHSIWRRDALSRSPKRLLMKEPPPSGDEIGDSSDSDDGLGGFIVDDVDDDGLEEDGTETAADGAAAARDAGKVKEGRASKKDKGKRSKKRKVASAAADGAGASAAPDAPAASSRKRRGRGKSQEQLQEGQEGEGRDEEGEDEQGDGGGEGRRRPIRKRGRRGNYVGRKPAALVAVQDGKAEEGNDSDGGDEPLRRSARTKGSKATGEGNGGNGSGVGVGVGVSSGKGRKKAKVADTQSGSESFPPSSDGGGGGGGGGSDSSDENSDDDDFSVRPCHTKNGSNATAHDAASTAADAGAKSRRQGGKGSARTNKAVEGVEAAEAGSTKERRAARKWGAVIDIPSGNEEEEEEGFLRVAAAEAGGGAAAATGMSKGKEEGKAKAAQPEAKKAKEKKVKAGKGKNGGLAQGEKEAPSWSSLPATGAGRATPPKRKSSMVNYRDMLHNNDRSSSSDDSGIGKEAGDGDDDGSAWEGEDDDDSDGDREEEQGSGGEGIHGERGKKQNCARDEDLDEEDGFAEVLRDDDDEEDEEDDDDEAEYGGEWGGAGGATKKDKWKTRRTARSERGVEDETKKDGTSRRKGRGSQNRYDVSEEEEEEEEVDDDNWMVDDDDNYDEEEDASFSHAAFFHEMAQSQEGGVSSLSVGTMTFKEAFLFYVEYIARATQGGGAGEAFMKRYVAQPRIPEHARYGKAKETVEKKLRISGESLCGAWRQDFRDTVMRYPHYGYHHVLGDEVHGQDRCSACNRSNRTSVVAFLSGAEYDPNRVWDGLRWDKHLPENWDDPAAMALSKQEAKATHYLGDTCKHKSHLFHSLTHYKLYLVSKVAAKIRGDDGLEPENFRGEGSPQTSKKKMRCLNFTENEFESLSSLLTKADDLNGVKWGGRAGVRGGHGKTFLQMGAASSILDWLSGEAPPEQFGGLGGGLVTEGDQAVEEEDDDDDEEEFHVGRGRRWRTVGSGGGRYG